MGAQGLRFDYLNGYDGHYIWQSGSQPGSYRCHHLLFFDDSPAPITPFREERHLHQYWYLYDGTGATMAVFLRRPLNFSSYHQYPHPRLTLTLASLTDVDASFIRTHAAAER